MLFKYPTLSLMAVFTLGLGIGLSTTVFCVVNGGLFKGLPFPDAERVVSVVGTNPTQNQPRLPISVQDLEVYRERQTSFEKIGAFGFLPMNLSDEEGRSERLRGGQLTVAAFEALGVQPLHGRGFREGADRPDAEPVILLSFDLWRERFGSSQAIRRLLHSDRPERCRECRPHGRTHTRRSRRRDVARSRGGRVAGSEPRHLRHPDE